MFYTTVIISMITIIKVSPWKHDDFSPYTDIVDRFHKTSGNWILAAAGSNGVPPPYKHCVHITVVDLNKTCNCIINTLNHTIFTVKIFKIVGINERNNTRINTLGPVIPYTKNEEFGHGYHRQELIYSTACWDPDSHNMMKYQYVVMLPDAWTGQSPYLLIVGINTRSPNPEIQIALITEHKAIKTEVEGIVKVYNNIAWRYFYEYDELLPVMAVKCAKDYMPQYSLFGSIGAWIFGDGDTQSYVKEEFIDTKGMGAYDSKYTLNCP